MFDKLINITKIVAVTILKDVYDRNIMHAQVFLMPNIDTGKGCAGSKDEI